MKNVFIADSAYSLFLYLIKYTNQISDTLFVLGPSVSHANIPQKLSFNKNAEILDQKLLASCLANKIDTLSHGDICFCYINAQSIGESIENEMRTRYYTIALSDGLSDFQNFPKYMAENRFDEYFSVETPYQTVHLPNHPHLETNRIMELWDQRSEEQKKQIASVFHVTEQDLEILRQKKVILVTQPLSEDGIMEETEKQAFYRDMMRAYPTNEIVIKPHPREKTKWNKIFKETPIIPKQIPMELLSAMVPVEKLVTFYSTAGTNLVEPRQVDFYSKDFEQLSFVHPEKPKMGLTPYVNIEEKFASLPFNWKRVPDPKHIWYLNKKGSIQNNYRSFSLERN